MRLYNAQMDEIPVSKSEILRYAGAREATVEVDALLESCLGEVRSKLIGRVCYREYDVTQYEGGIDLGFTEISSADLQRYLSSCNKIILLAATVGIEIDRLIMKYQSLSPSRALMLDEIGAERIEALCDSFAEHLQEKGMKLKPRVSPGYGDIPLEMQRDIFASLDCGRMLGLALSDSLLMSPTKSVTAIIGISE